MSEQSLFNQILEAIESNELTLPTQPEVALKIRETSEDPNVTVPKLSDVIGSDPAITARLIRVANSPLIRGTVTVDSLQNAITRLGLNFVCNLATGLAMEQIFQATSDVIDKHMRVAWQQSTEIAALSHVIAKNFTKIPPDQATLAGLLHTIGILPILSYAESQNKLDDEDELLKIIEQTHPKLGAAILAAWQFDPVYTGVPQNFMEFERETPNNEPDCTDVVMIAYLQSIQGTSHPHAQLDQTKIKAYARLGIEPGTNLLEDENLAEQISQAKSLLN